MTIAGVSFWTILAAAVAGWLVGAAWYTAFAQPWVAAHGRTMEEVRATPPSRMAATYGLTFVLELVMAGVLAWFVVRSGPVSLASSIGIAALAWLGLVATTLGVNNMFGGRRLSLAVIDAGHWLAVLLVMGAVIGAPGT